jgi:hypothetical protein
MAAMLAGMSYGTEAPGQSCHSQTAGGFYNLPVVSSLPAARPGHGLQLYG